MIDYSNLEPNGYCSTSEFPEWGRDEPDEENPNYRTEFDERVAAMTEADLRERSKEPEADRLRRLDAKLAEMEKRKCVTQ